MSGVTFLIPCSRTV